MHTSLQQNDDGHSSARRKIEHVCSKMCNSPNPFCLHIQTDLIYSDHEEVTWQQHLRYTPFELSQ